METNEKPPNKFDSKEQTQAKNNKINGGMLRNLLE